MTQEARGEVYDLGYQRYEGPREGRFRAQKALWVNTVRGALGIGRSPAAWMVSGALIALAVAPAVIIVIVAAVFGGIDFDTAGHAGYYDGISLVLIIFSAIAAPQVLCPDRRDGVIALYLVRPITAADYLGARGAALFTVIFGVMLTAQTVLFAGTLLASGDPVDYVRENWLDVPRFAAAGAVLALLLTAVPMVIASFTTRRVIATLTIVGLFFLSTTFSEILIAPVCESSGRGEPTCEPLTREYAPWFALTGLLQPPVYVNNQIFGVVDRDDPSLPLNDLHPAVPGLWTAIAVAGSGALLWRRYDGTRL